MENSTTTTALTAVEQEERTFALIQKKAELFCKSTIVPTQYQGEANMGNTVIALDMANRLKANPLMVMQNLYIVHGKPAWSSKFLIATINSCGKFTPLRYEVKTSKSGATGCRAYAYEKTDTERANPLFGTWVSTEMAQKEGWATNAGSKWQTMPEQMLKYRAAAFWQRIYAPEISMGLMTADELEDIHDSGKPIEELTEGEGYSEVEDMFAQAMHGNNESETQEAIPEGSDK